MLISLKKLCHKMNIDATIRNKTNLNELTNLFLIGKM